MSAPTIAFLETGRLGTRRGEAGERGDLLGPALQNVSWPVTRYGIEESRI